MEYKNKQNKMILFGIVIVFILALAPVFLDGSIIYRLSSILISALFATSFNLIFGYTGMVSFGQAAYFAIGAYTVSLFLNVVPSFFLGLGLAALISAIAALVLGFIALRTAGIYFGILTLALGELVYQVFYKSNWAGGQNGIAGIKAPNMNFFGWDLKLAGMPYYYFAILVTVLLSFLILWVVVNSRFGKTLISIKEDPVRAEFLGVNVKRYRLIAFIISGMFAGVAGGLSAPLTSIITADLASWTNSATPIIITLFGGYAYFLGPTVGAFIYEFFRYATASFSDASNLLIGLMLLIVILVLPKGVLGLIDIIRTKRTKLSKYKMEKNQKEVDKEVVVYDEGT